MYERVFSNSRYTFSNPSCVLQAFEEKQKVSQYFLLQRLFNLTNHLSWIPLSTKFYPRQLSFEDSNYPYKSHLDNFFVFLLFHLFSSPIILSRILSNTNPQRFKFNTCTLHPPSLLLQQIPSFPVDSLFQCLLHICSLIKTSLTSSATIFPHNQDLVKTNSVQFQDLLKTVCKMIDHLIFCLLYVSSCSTRF